MSDADEAFKQLVRSSRTYRRYSGDALTDGQVRALLDVARLAPSGNNLQVLRVRYTVEHETCVKLSQHHGWAAALKGFDGPAAGEEPGAYVGITCPQASATSAIRLMDVGILAQTLCLAAAAEGLGTCMIKSFDSEAAELLGVPDDMQLLLMIALGVPASDEKIVLEDADTEHGVHYWRSEGNVHHVPKISVDDLLS